MSGKLLCQGKYYVYTCFWYILVQLSLVLRVPLYICFHFFQHLNKYLEICTAQSDSEGIGKACDAIAKAYAR